MEKSSLKSVIPVFLLFMAMFLAWFVIGSIGFFRAVTSKSWPTTEGTIIASNVVRPSGKSTKYVAEVSYTYKVNNQEYTGNKLKATTARGTSEWAKAKTEEYPLNAIVTVYYNPKKPHRALIEPGLQSDNLWMTLLPLTAIVLISMALRKQIQNRKNSADNMANA